MTISLVRCDLSNSAGQERPLAGLSLRNPEAPRHHTPSLVCANDLLQCQLGAEGPSLPRISYP